MINRTIMLLAILLPFLGISQTSTLNKEIVKVIELEDINKSTLYSNALSFFANNFKSANDVIQMKDESSGKVIGKGFIKDGNDSRKLTITIDVKDNKYRYAINIEPFIELKTQEITGIDKLGVVKGKTYIRYGYVNGQLTIDKDNSYFECVGQMGCHGEKYYYSGKNEFMGLSSKAKDTWKNKVDEKIDEIIDDIKNNSTSKDDEDLNRIINNLENEMSKKDDW